MDPTTTWNQMLTAFGEEDWETALELADAMLAWFRAGGFPPIVSVGSSVGDCVIVIEDVQARRSIADSVARAIAAHAKQKLR